jgi:hypothetical protein
MVHFQRVDFMAYELSQNKTSLLMLGTSIIHAYNPSSLGGWDQEDHDSRPAQAKTSQDPHLQNNHGKIDWSYGSSGTVPALQAWSPEFKTPSCQINK